MLSASAYTSFALRRQVASWTGGAAVGSGQASGRAHAMSYVLQVEGIPGTSMARGREKWLEVDSIDWGVSLSTDGAAGRGGARTGRATARPVTVTTPVSSASPALFLACVQGRSVPEATFEATLDGQAGPLVTLRIELTEVLLGTFDLSGSDGQPRPDTRFSLDYREITLTTFAVSEDGSRGDESTATWTRR